MALSPEAKSAAMKGALGELIKMLGGMNMDRARKKKMGDMAVEDPEDAAEAPEDPNEIPDEEDLQEGDESDAEDVDAAAEEALPPRFRKKMGKK